MIHVQVEKHEVVHVVYSEKFLSDIRKGFLGVSAPKLRHEATICGVLGYRDQDAQSQLGMPLIRHRTVSRDSSRFLIVFTLGFLSLENAFYQTVLIANPHPFLSVKFDFLGIAD